MAESAARCFSVKCTREPGVTKKLVKTGFKYRAASAALRLRVKIGVEPRKFYRLRPCGRGRLLFYYKL